MRTMIGRFPVLRSFRANPVVVRDLRAQLRGPRAYAYIAGYLLLLGALALAGYAVSTGQSLSPADWGKGQSNIVDAQASLAGFYYFIFGTLAAVIVLIAPALTAASVVGERQRQSFDLLVTTPLTAGQLLVGKLLSSVAFLGLLLALSLPASALCVLLGGAAWGDVLRVYLTLAVDGVVLSAIGLYFSCAVRTPLLATLWTCLGVAGYVFLTFYTPTTAMAWSNGTPDPVQTPLLVSLWWLNPIGAIAPQTGADGAGGDLFRLIAFLALSGLLVRLLLTAATYRLGLFGAQSGVSLRRQALIVVGIGIAICAHGVAKGTAPDAVSPVVLTLILPLLALAPFLPGLFVPVSPENAPPGLTPETAANPSRYRFFDLRRTFFPEHSGALPWYTALVVTLMLSILAGRALAGQGAGELVLPLAAGCFYLLGVGGLLWVLSRLAARLVRELSAARAAAFGLYICVFGLPTLFLSLGQRDWLGNPLINLWLLSPFLHCTEGAGILEALTRTGLLSVALAMFFFVLEQELQRRE